MPGTRSPGPNLWKVNAPEVYLDHAASTPMRSVASRLMSDPDGIAAANASGTHRAARRARAAVDDARELLAGVLGADPGDVVFTSGGTESDNLAVFGRVAAVPGLALCSAVEHPAVLEAVRRVGGQTLAVSADGRLDLDALEARLTEASRAGERVSLVSIMAVNNEVGALQPVGEAMEIIRRLAPGAAVHTDAVQGLMWLDLREIGRSIDLLSVSAHKFGGPQGVGALVVRRGTSLVAQHIGGGQEREWRSGTHNVAGIAAMAAAAAEADAQRDAEVERLRALRDRLVERVVAGLGAAGGQAAGDGAGEAAGDGAGVSWTGARIEPAHLAAGFAHFCFDGVESDALLFLLDDAGVAASAASACASGAQHPSHVLEAMGIGRDSARGSLRLSLGHTSTDSEVDLAADAVIDSVRRLRSHRH